MAEADWLIIGLVIGLVAGIPIGWLLAQLAQAARPTAPASVVFERDKEGRIVAIHYVPGARSG